MKNTQENEVSAGEPICTMKRHNLSFSHAIKIEYMRYF